MRRPAVILAALTAAALACGCGPHSRSDPIVDWERAVAGAAGVDPGSRPRTAAARLPGRRERVLDVSDLRVGWLDYFSLQGCRWGELVSQRNSSLGRFMPRTRRLVYELEFLEAAGPCLEGLSPARRRRFDELVATKQRELGRHVWNAIWAGPEIERFLSSSPSPILGREVAAGGALAELEAAAAADFGSPADGEALQAALGELRRATGAGPLLHDLARAGGALESVANYLERVAREGCDTGSRRLVRLFEERYVPVVEPLVADLERDARPILASLAAIYERTRRRSGEPVPALDHYYARVLRADGDALGPRLRAASLRHARAWAPVLTACGRLPASGAGPGVRPPSLQPIARTDLSRGSTPSRTYSNPRPSGSQTDALGRLAARRAVTHRESARKPWLPGALSGSGGPIRPIACGLPPDDRAAAVHGLSGRWGAAASRPAGGAAARGTDPRR